MKEAQQEPALLAHRAILAVVAPQENQAAMGHPEASERRDKRANRDNQAKRESRAQQEAPAKPGRLVLRASRDRPERLEQKAQPDQSVPEVYEAHKARLA